MPLTVRVFSHGIDVTARGQVTLEEARRAIAEHPPDRARPALPILVDATAVTGAPSASELRQIVKHLQPLVAEGMGAMAIITASPFVYGVARMFSMFGQAISVDVMPFRCREEAENWLRRRQAGDPQPS